MLKKYVLIVTLVCICFVGSGVAQDDNPLPSLSELTETWTQIELGGDTLCSKGAPYSFFVHPGEPDKLAIFFEGGGMCWNAETCGPRQNSLFTEAISTTADALSTYNGMFAFDNPENPFADYSMVFVPYCTADMHMGNSTVTYGEGEGAVEIHHNGFVNANAALDWAYANFESPERVFVTGGSAGALGSIFHTPFIMEHYPDAAVRQLGDSGGGYRATKGELAELFTNWGTIDILPEWVADFQDITAEAFTFERLYTATAAHYPDNIVGQYNSAQDQVQNLYLALMVPSVFYTQVLPASMADLSAASPNYRYFTAGGHKHGILGDPEFYTYAVDGLRFRDWVDALANGDAPVNVECTTACFKEEVVVNAD